jgi:hypothetical protein
VAFQLNFPYFNPIQLIFFFTDLLHLPSSTVLVHPQHPLFVSPISCAVLGWFVLSLSLVPPIEVFSIIHSNFSFYFSQLKFFIFPNQNLRCSSCAVDALSSHHRSFLSFAVFRRHLF